ncbi:MarR family winged helix-turn-helix transcriptional regulator [Sphingomonas crocodyli]|nr:MarR family transcriptional regulator [Sphingomonas crocodyli]
MARHATLLIPLFEAFSWFDEGLQTLLREAGWTAVTRPQTMVLIAIGQGIERAVDIARAIGVTRQSVGVTIAEMAAEGLLEMVDDPNDRRAKRVHLSDKGERRREDSRRAMAELTAELERRIGKASVTKLGEALQKDWGPPVAR